MMAQDDVINLIGGFAKAAFLQHAVIWGIFERTHNFTSYADLAEAINLLPGKLKPILDAITALGFLEQEGTSYRNTALTEQYLTSTAPDDLRSIVLQLHNEWLHWVNLDTSLRSDTPDPWMNL